MVLPASRKWAPAQKYAPVAMLRHFTREDEESIRRLEAEEALAEMKSLADDIGKAWKSPKSAVDLIDEQRR